MHLRTAVWRRSLLSPTESSMPTASRIDLAKKTVREERARARRAAHRDAGRAAAGLVCERFQEARMQGLAIDRGDAVSGYWPLRDELDIRRLLTGLYDEGVTCALPVVAGKERPLVFRRWRPGDALASASFGLAEPSADKPEVDPRVMLVPLLAVDSIGNRLGYGAGYYDRTLAERRARGPVIAVGIGFEAQRVAALPVDGYDQRLDWLVTERSVARFGG